MLMNKIPLVFNYFSYKICTIIIRYMVRFCDNKMHWYFKLLDFKKEISFMKVKKEMLSDLHFLV